MIHGKPFDALAAAEACYRFDRLGRGWLERVLESIQPLIDRSGFGVFGAFYHAGTLELGKGASPSASAPGAWTVSIDDGGEVCSEAGEALLCAMPPHVADVYNEGSDALPADYVRRVFLSNVRLVRAASLQCWNDFGPVRSGAARSAGMRDLLILRLGDEKAGCRIGSFQSEPGEFPVAVEELLARFWPHVSAGYRLQSKLPAADCWPEHAAALLEPGGRLLHARGDAQGRRERETLERAVRLRDAARALPLRRNAHRALELWEALVAGRWTLVDHFEQDGRRFVLAMESVSDVRRLERLTTRERAVVEHAAKGLHNKGIAYELGVAHATVKVLLARAAHKLGARGREELIVCYRKLITADGAGT